MRLYLTTPSQLITFNLPSNILWDAAPNFSQTNSLYMFVFEWNPILNKWLGNQLWKPVSLAQRRQEIMGVPTKINPLGNDLLFEKDEDWLTDLVVKGILPKQISEYTIEDIRIFCIFAL